MRRKSKNTFLLPVLIGVFSLLPAGRITAQTFTTLYRFTPPPFGDLDLSGNTLYGTAADADSSGNDAVFKLNTNGTGFTTLHSVTALDQSYGSSSHGANPFAGFITSGQTPFETAANGGDSVMGTLFNLSFGPQLIIAPSGTNFTLSWPISFAGFSYAGYYLEDTANLGHR